MSFKYTIYGLVIDSEILLPELRAGGEHPDVFIRRGSVAWKPPDGAERGHHATEAEIYFYWTDACSAVVRGGSEIVIDAHPGVEEYVVRLFILGTILAAALHQRRMLVLHASSVVLNGGAVVFLGHQGYGKSTIAAALQARGHRLIGDDLAVMHFDNDDIPVVIPGFPQIKLWPDASSHMGVAPEKLIKLHPRIEKHAYRTQDNFTLEPVPLKCLYALDLEEEIAIEPVLPHDAFLELVRHTYFTNYLEDTGAFEWHFARCGKLLSTTPVFTVKRPSSLDLLDNVARLLEEHSATINPPGNH